MQKMDGIYGPDWHLKMPSQAKPFRVEGGADFSPVAPAAGVAVRMCEVKAADYEYAVIHQIKLSAFQLVNQAAPYAGVVHQELPFSATLGKLFWYLSTPQAELAYLQNTNITEDPRHIGFCTLQNLTTNGGGIDPIIIAPGTSAFIKIIGLDPTAGMDLSVIAGGRLVGALSGYRLSSSPQHTRQAYALING